ncbi:MAG: SUMF1/EgtB/PvdO family nonheme iron enzyme [Saprospiraceae bacterium]|nr:SUMF1/EgtB/PvdO family nonheme iron enzyme [Saprospiraceae bacterium]
MEKFIRDFKHSEHKAAIRTLLKEKRAEVKWEKIKNSRHIEVFDEFIDDFPDSPLAQLAQQKIDSLEIEAEENARQEQNRLELERQKREAEQKRLEEAEEQLWQLYKAQGTPSVYLDKYPNGRFAVQAFNMKTSIEEAERQKKIDAENAKKEKERLAAIERKKREEEEERIRTLYEPEMVLVKGGTFKMGSNDYTDEQPIHDVTLNDFYIGKYPVTQKQWQAIMGDNPSYFKGETLPVECVSWEDCQVFIKKLNEKTGKTYRLPTEAEWEYAARGGNQSKGYTYSGSNDVKSVAWFTENSDSKTHPVGQKQANELGIYDMSGNVWEWCSDWYDENYYKNSPSQNPKGPSTGSFWVLRGGSWLYSVLNCRSSCRLRNSPIIRYNDYGFRLARND